MNFTPLLDSRHDTSTNSLKFESVISDKLETWKDLRLSTAGGLILQRINIMLLIRQM